jgi:hypothetical protein
MTSIFEYCRYWKILEDTGKLVFTSICTSIATVYRETGRKENRGGRKEKRVLVAAERGQIKLIYETT